MSKLTKKDRIAHLEFQVAWLTDAVHELQGTENPESKPQLKQLDQSVFNGLDEKWQFAAVDDDSSVAVYLARPTCNHFQWYVEDKSLGLSYKYFSNKKGYDASNWKNSLIERDSKELSGSDLTRKMLADSTDMVNCYVSDDSDYDALNDKDERTIVGFSDGWFHTNSVASWKYAVPAPKEKELTGSELCRAMLARGDKYILCLVGDGGDYRVANQGYAFIVTGVHSNGEFDTPVYTWEFAVPINNQGEPLTAAEAGL